MKKYRTILMPVICVIATLLLFGMFFLFGYVPSMEPTLHEGSLIPGCRLYGELETGSIIIFEHDGDLLVKRIAAFPGETV